MTIRVSQAMTAKLSLVVKSNEPVEANPLCDWAVHLFRCQRSQYVLVVNTTSLFSVVLPGRGLTNEKKFLTALMPALRDQHRIYGLESAYLCWIEPIFVSGNPLTWSKVGLRRVTGSMNEQIYYAKHIADEVTWQGEVVTPEKFSFKLNQNRLSVIAYHKPVEAHRQMIESLSA